MALGLRSRCAHACSCPHVSGQGFDLVYVGRPFQNEPWRMTCGASAVFRTTSTSQQERNMSTCYPNQNDKRRPRITCAHLRRLNCQMHKKRDQFLSPSFPMPMQLGHVTTPHFQGLEDANTIHKANLTFEEQRSRLARASSDRASRSASLRSRACMQRLGDWTPQKVV